MDLNALLDRVRRHTNHVYPDTFHMIDLMNDAQNQLIEGAKLRGVQTITLVPGTSVYPIPSDFKSPGNLVDTTDESYVEYALVDIATNEFGYAIENGNIHIKPVPQAERTLTHYYYKYAQPMELSTDTPEIDSNYHDLLAVYAAGMILLLPQLSGQDKSLADRYLGRWEAGKQNFFQDMQRKNKATRGKVVNIW